MAARLSSILDEIMSKNQSSLMKWRNIGDNILTANELVSKYHVNKGGPWCAIKVNLRKAYDSICWDYLEEVLTGLWFPRMFINWVAGILGLFPIDGVKWWEDKIFQSKKMVETRWSCFSSLICFMLGIFI